MTQSLLKTMLPKTNPRLTPLAKFASLALLLVFCVGCSSYGRKWKQAVAQPIPPGAVAGPWEGTWVSDANGHHGKLRCILTETGTNTYSAHFHATWKVILQGQYTTELRGETKDHTFQFTGQHDMGKLFGGTYHYEGYATATNFFSTYKSSKDHGKFEMKRPVSK